MTTTNSISETILSESYELLTASKPSNFPHKVDTNHDLVPIAFRNYANTVCSYPVVVRTDFIKILKEICLKFMPVMRNMVAEYFKEDLQKISDFYFNGDLKIGERALNCYNKNLTISNRLDLISTENNLFVLEINIGSSLGGWQVGYFNTLIENMHEEFQNPVTKKNFAYINTLTTYLEFLVDQIKEYVVIENTINIFVCLDSIENVDEKNYSLQFLNDLYVNELTKRGFEGQVYSDSTENLELKDDKIYLNGMRIHSVLVIDLSLPELPDRLYDAFLQGTLYLPDHIGTNLIDDKRNFALLYRMGTENRFSTEDNKFILDHIPWTAILNDKHVIYNEEKHDLLTLLKSKKDQFVIKPATGSQGKGISIGKFLSPDEWATALKNARATKNYIVQEFCDPKKLLAPAGDEQWVPFSIIWGAFAFGDTYGGTWVRMSNTLIDKTGVINSATDATETIVYEYLQ
jgi:hypothetical protein